MLPVVLEGFVEFGAAKVLFIRFHSEQIVGADAEQIAERQKQRDVGHRRIGLPTADRLRGNGEQLGKLLLRELCFPALFPNSLSNGHRLSTFLKMLLLTGTPAAYDLERRPFIRPHRQAAKHRRFPRRGRGNRNDRRTDAAHCRSLCGLQTAQVPRFLRFASQKTRMAAA